MGTPSGHAVVLGTAGPASVVDLPFTASTLLQPPLCAGTGIPCQGSSNAEATPQTTARPSNRFPAGVIVAFSASCVLLVFCAIVSTVICCRDSRKRSNNRSLTLGGDVNGKRSYSMDVPKLLWDRYDLNPDENRSRFSTSTISVRSRSLFHPPIRTFSTFRLSPFRFKEVTGDFERAPHSAFSLSNSNHSTDILLYSPRSLCSSRLGESVGTSPTSQSVFPEPPLLSHPPPGRNRVQSNTLAPPSSPHASLLAAAALRDSQPRPLMTLSPRRLSAGTVVEDGVTFDVVSIPPSPTYPSGRWI